MKHIKITDEIREAIHAACKQAGGQSAFSKSIGVSQPLISMMLHGVYQTARRSTWDKLYPAISPYLPDGFKEQDVWMQHSPAPALAAPPALARIAAALESIAGSLERLSMPLVCAHTSNNNQGDQDHE